MSEPKANQATLKRCPVPWCQGPAEIREAYPDMRTLYAICTQCGLRSPDSKPFDREGLVTLWNTPREEPVVLVKFEERTIVSNPPPLLFTLPASELPPFSDSVPDDYPVYMSELHKLLKGQEDGD